MKAGDRDDQISDNQLFGDTAVRLHVFLVLVKSIEQKL